MSKSTVNGIASARTFFERGKITRALDGQTCRQPAKTVTLDLTREASGISVRLREILPDAVPTDNSVQTQNIALMDLGC
jgi:hypothetical protein